MGELLATNITVLSVVHGDYFERFATAFFESLESAQCENAILVSDKAVPVPSFVNLIVKNFAGTYDFCNTANEALDSEWGLHMGFDDLLLPNALEPIESDADVYGWPHRMEGISTGLSAYSGGYEQMVSLDYNPMEGGFAYRKSLLQEIPFRDVTLFDWSHFCELSHFGKTVEFSGTPRTVWIRRPDCLSLNNVDETHQEVYEFQEKLRVGLIKKGVPE